MCTRRSLCSRAACDADLRGVVSASRAVCTEAPSWYRPRRTHLVPCSPLRLLEARGRAQMPRLQRNCSVSRPCRFRYFNVYGPRQRADSTYAAVIPPFIDALRKSEPRPRRRPLKPGLQLHRRRSRWSNRCRSGTDRSLLGTCLQHRAGRDARPARAARTSSDAYPEPSLAPNTLTSGRTTCGRHGPIRRRRMRDLDFQASASFEEGLRRTVE
jgi:hypothetical protein